MGESTSLPSHCFRQHASSVCLLGLVLLAVQFLSPARAWPQAIQEVRIQWSTSPPLPADTPAAQRSQSVSHLFSLLDRRKMSGRMPRQRDPELNFDKIVVVARDREEKIIAWHVLADPRIIRAESPGPGGELTGRILYRDRADFLITLPDDPGITRIDFYHPRWTGAQFDLDPIGALALP